MIGNYYLFKLEKIESFIQATFDYLPNDNYLKSNKKFRKRLYSAGTIINNIFEWDLIIREFEQSSVNNDYLGDIKRQYKPLSNTIKFFVQNKLIHHVIVHLPRLNYKIGVHQIRVIADNTTMGIPVPEGIHQDGFDYVFILCVSNINVAGGNSILFNSKHYEDILFEYILQPTDCLLLNDRKLFHYVSPIVPKLPGNCSRDVIVMTFEKI